MLQQALDFREESERLHEVLSRLGDAQLERKTQFKDWTLNDVIAHLHFWNYAADLSLADGDAFAELLTDMLEALGENFDHMAYTHRWLEGCRGTRLLERWHDFYLAMSGRFEVADASQRVRWAGPDMSVRSSITARQMETWAHGQEVYDILGLECPNTDRIKNVCVLGVNTFGWTYANRGRETPETRPYVRLTAPSGAIWEWNDAGSADRVEGDAVEFCKVVTQTRNLADTRLVVSGPVAQEWMSMAQCFAGPVEDPPPLSTRYRAGH